MNTPVLMPGFFGHYVPLRVKSSESVPAAIVPCAFLILQNKKRPGVGLFLGLQVSLQLEVFIKEIRYGERKSAY